MTPSPKEQLQTTTSEVVVAGENKLTHRHHHHHHDNEKNRSTQSTITPIRKKFVYRCPCGGLPIHLMNGNVENEEYEPTPIEEFANFITHIIPAILSIFAIIYMFQTVITTKREAVSAWIYGGCCTLLFTISSSYHLTGFIWGKDNQLNRIFQKMDHTIIFTFIAASYTPWLILIDIGTDNLFGRAVLTFIWAFAVFGTMKSCLNNFFPHLSSLMLYLVMGWVSIIYMIVIVCLLASGSEHLKSELHFGKSFMHIAIGGLLYSFGTIIFNQDGRVPFAHAIWHLFVAAAAAFHMHAVHTYLMILE